MAKVSVIVPVYNTEKYLPKCLDSLTSQTLSDIEIICINDCSTDNSLAVLQEYAKKDNRIKIIDFKENKGAAVARNTGIDAAMGEYIGFVDSDDFVDLDFYEKLYTKAKETSADVVKGANLMIHHIDGSITVDKFNDKIRKNKFHFFSQYTTAIFSNNLIKQNNICFPEGMLVGEDPVFLIHAVFCSEKIEVIDGAQYHYMRREQSLNSESWNSKKVNDYIKYINIVVKYLNIYKITPEQRHLFVNILLDDIFCTRATKVPAFGQDYNKLSNLIQKIRPLGQSGKIKILFDGTIFSLAQKDIKAKRGIYWVSINILKLFVKDPNFDVTLLFSSSMSNMDFYKSDPDLKNLKCICMNFSVGAKGGNKVFSNPNFNPMNYDVYFNTAHNWKFFHPSLLNCYFLHDTLPLLKYNWFGEFFKGVFWKFHSEIPYDAYTFHNSHCTRKDFLRFFDNLDENKAFVSYISSQNDFTPLKNEKDKNAVLRKYGVVLPENAKYIFFMGAVDDVRKNLKQTLQTFVDFVDTNDISNLYFCLGGSGKDNFLESLKDILGNKYDKYKDYIVSLGYVEAEDVNVLYSNSLFFVFLSLYEGFGMPLLEAMQAGTPVICADNSSLPEVVGDAAILVDTNNKKEILNAFNRMYFDENLRKDYIKKGLERSKMFSWEKTYKIISEKIIAAFNAE